MFFFFSTNSVFGIKKHIEGGLSGGKGGDIVCRGCVKFGTCGFEDGASAIETDIRHDKGDTKDDKDD